MFKRISYFFIQILDWVENNQSDYELIKMGTVVSGLVLILVSLDSTGNMWNIAWLITVISLLVEQIITTGQGIRKEKSYKVTTTMECILCVIYIYLVVTAIIRFF